MTIETAPAPTTAPTADDAAPPGMAAPRIVGLRCRNCGRPEALGPSYVCAACFGPLEVAYDLDARRADASTARRSRRRPPGIWRYLELLPVDAPPARGLARRLDAARRAPTASARRSASTASGSRTTPATRPSRSRTGRSRSPRRGPSTSGSTRSPAPRPATSPAPRPPPRPRSACRPTCSSRPTSSRPRSTTRSPTARRSSRSTARTTTSTGCASRSPTRPAGASSTSTCGRSTPRAARRSRSRSPRSSAGGCPTSSSRRSRPGAMFTKLAKGFDELAEVGLDRAHADPVRRRPGGRLRAGRDGVRGRARRTSSRSATPDTIVRSLAIGNPADGRYAVELARATGRLDRGDRRRRRPPPRSARSRRSRASTRRRPAA